MFDNGHCHFRRHKWDLERKYEDLTVAIQRMWNVQSKTDTSSNIGNWNHLQIIQKIPDQQTGKARNQGTTRKQPSWALHTYCREG